MTDTPNPYGRTAVHILPPGHNPAAGHQPAADRSIGTSRRGTVYVGTVEEQRGPGLPSQEQMAGRDPNAVRALDQGGKTFGAHVAPHHSILEPDGFRPYSGGEITNKHVIDVPGVGQMRVREALALNLIDPAAIGMAEAAAPGKSLAMQQHEARQRAEAEQTPEASGVDPAVDRGLHQSYVEVATQLDAAITKAGGSTEAVLDALAKGTPDGGVKALAGKVAEAMGGADQFRAAVDAMELRVLDAVDRALPAGVDLDQVCDVLEAPENSRRWGQAWVAYLRTGDATLVQQFAKEVARSL